MGVYYYSACHTCRTYTPPEKYPAEYAEFLHQQWVKRFHDGHDTEFTNEYDEGMDYRIEGWNKVKYCKLGEYITEDKGEPYNMVSDDEMDKFREEIWEEWVKLHPEVKAVL